MGGLKGMERLKDRIKKHEGLRLKAYRDTRGILTIGYGHSLRNPISKTAAEVILQDDIVKAMNDFFNLPEGVRRIDPVRREVILEMLFNLGMRGFLSFRRMIDAIISEDFERASSEMLKSKWAKQTGKRAIELAHIMKTGRL